MCPAGADTDPDLPYRLAALPMAGAVLHLGAHPDDENTGALAYLSRGLGVRTVYWSSTRGEGGQNRTGSERDEALGILRTWESLSAGEMDGAEVLYGPFYDFGFSKSGEDALVRWGREDVVREIVRAIRRVQPDVVISRWSGGPEDGHGQHQAIGLVAEEAFEVAADPGAFPELGLPAWTARKLYHSLGGDWQPGEDVVLGARVPEYEEEGALRINTGVLDPIAGRTYQEQASLAYNRHRSQAMAFLPERGDFFYYYRLIRSRVPVDRPERSLFDGLDPTIAGLVGERGSERLTKAMGEAHDHARASIATFRPRDPGDAGREVLAGVARLREAREILAEEEPDEPSRDALDRYLDRKVRAFEEAAARCLGIALEATVDTARITAGERVRVTARLWNHGRAAVGAPSFEMRVPGGWSAEQVGEPRPMPDRAESGEATDVEFRVAIPETARLSSPYWLREPRTPYRYVWSDDPALGQPFDDPVIEAAARVEIDGVPLELGAPALRRETFVGGYRELPPAVLPPIALTPKQRRMFLPLMETGHRLQLQLTARCIRADGAAGTLTLRAPGGWQAVPDRIPLEFARQGQSQLATFELTIPPDVASGTHELRYEVESGDHRYSVVLDAVRRAAPGVSGPADETNAVAEVFVMLPATVTVNLLDAAFVRTLRYGYIVGVEEDILDALERFELDVSVLSEADLAYADLSSFDTIVVGPNAYLLHPEVRKNAARLLEYVEGGGTLVVQYQGYGYQEGDFTPYPFRYNQPHDRVTFPDAPVTVLDPDHPVGHVPNQITPRDFDGWVHDRGLYFFGEWDRRYTPILASRDPDEEPKEGGLVVASYGRGTFVYAAYSFFRQIPRGVQGAIRLFANLIGLAEARIQERLEHARGVPLLSFMDDADLYQVARLMSERWIDDGEYLFRQGDRGGELYVVLEGEIDVIKEGAGGSRVVHVTRPGEATGEVAVLADSPRTASLRARGDAKVLAMRGDHFRALLQAHPDLADGVIRMLAGRLASSEGEDRSTSPSG